MFCVLVFPFARANSFLRGKVRASVNQKLEESGEKEKLKELLRKKLIERGWRDELKEYCKEVCVRRAPDVSTST